MTNDVGITLHSPTGTCVQLICMLNGQEAKQTNAYKTSSILTLRRLWADGGPLVLFLLLVNADY